MTENERLRLVRKKLNLSQVELANALNMKQGSISDTERSKDSIKVSNSLKVLLNKEFNVNIEWLETGEGEMFTANRIEKEIDEIEKDDQINETNLNISKLIRLLEDKDEQIKTLLRMLDDQIKINKKIANVPLEDRADSADVV